MNNHYTNWGYWQFRAVWTQANAGGGNVIIAFGGDGFRGVLLTLRMGPDDYGAGRTTRIQLMDEDNVAVWEADPGSTSLDNEVVIIPALGQVITGFHEPVFIKPFITAGSDVLRVTASSLAQNETLTIGIRMLVLSEEPAVDVSNSTGTVAAATPTVNRID